VQQNLIFFTSNSKDGFMIAKRLLLFTLIALGPTLLLPMEERTVNDRLREAAEQNDIESVKKFLLLGGDPNFLTGTSRPLLEIVIRKGNTDLAQVLLEWGASLNPMKMGGTREYINIEYKDKNTTIDRYMLSIRWAIEHGIIGDDTTKRYAVSEILSMSEFDSLGLKDLLCSISYKVQYSPPISLLLDSSSWQKYSDFPHGISNDLISTILTKAFEGNDFSKELITLADTKIPLNENDKRALRIALIIAAGQPSLINSVKLLLSDNFPEIRQSQATLTSALRTAATSPRFIPNIENVQAITQQYVNEEGWNTAMGEALVLVAAQGSTEKNNDIVSFILNKYGENIPISSIQMALERALLTGHYTASAKIWQWIVAKKLILGVDPENWSAPLTRMLMFAILFGKNYGTFSLFTTMYNYIRDNKMEYIDISAVILFVQVLIRQVTLNIEILRARFPEAVEALQETLNQLGEKQGANSTILDMLKKLESKQIEEIPLAKTLKGTIKDLIKALTWPPLGKATLLVLIASFLEQSKSIK
jgi:ankyrin repeat protein